MSKAEKIRKYLAWAKLYVGEEPRLNLIFEVNKRYFPNICLAFPSANGLFPAGFLLICDRRPTEKEEKILDTLSNQGFLVMACNDWNTCTSVTMDYLKQESQGPDAIDPRWLPDDVSLN